MKATEEDTNTQIRVRTDIYNTGKFTTFSGVVGWVCGGEEWIIKLTSVKVEVEVEVEVEAELGNVKY